jgi:apocytochrome f
MNVSRRNFAGRFSLAPKELIPEEMKTKVGKLYFQPYAPEKKNILVVGPVPGKKYSEITIPFFTRSNEG